MVVCVSTATIVMSSDFLKPSNNDVFDTLNSGNNEGSDDTVSNIPDNDVNDTTSSEADKNEADKNEADKNETDKNENDNNEDNKNEDDKSENDKPEVVDPKLLPIYYEIDDDVIKVVSKYNENEDRCIELRKKGGNNLFDFYTAYIIDNKESTVAEHTNGVEVYRNTTDFHAPFIIRALKNIDGDNPNSWEFTGGNHAYNGNHTGSATARTTKLEFFVDGKKISNGKGEFSGKANVIEIRWSNNVQANNTVKKDGSGREVLTEKHTMTFDGKEWISHVELIPLEDIRCYTWYGFQCSLNSEVLPNNKTGEMYAGTYRFIDGAYKESIDLTAAEIPVNASGNNNAKGMISYKNTNAVSMIIDEKYHLGKRNMYSGDKGVFFNVKTKKTYFNIIENQILKANTSYYLRGTYKFYSI